MRWLSLIAHKIKFSKKNLPPLSSLIWSRGLYTLFYLYLELFYFCAFGKVCCGIKVLYTSRLLYKFIFYATSMIDTTHNFTILHNPVKGVVVWSLAVRHEVEV